MNAGTLQALVALIVACAALLAAIYRRGRRDGKIDEVLERLTGIGEDHEVRLRDLERPGTHM